MIFIIRTSAHVVPDIEIKMSRKTPAIAGAVSGHTDHFCRGDPEAAKTAGWPVVAVHDGWYADDCGGGMAIWGQGMFWEVRDTPFSVKQASGPEDWPSGPREPDEDALNVRQAIFRG